MQKEKKMLDIFWIDLSDSMFEKAHIYHGPPLSARGRDHIHFAVHIW